VCLRLPVNIEIPENSERYHEKENRNEKGREKLNPDEPLLQYLRRRAITIETNYSTTQH